MLKELMIDLDFIKQDGNQMQSPAAMTAVEVGMVIEVLLPDAGYSITLRVENKIG